ncbi:hypothetical protein ACWC5I_23800 [Kitasatospora sp. NPDC001574]
MTTRTAPTRTAPRAVILGRPDWQRAGHWLSAANLHPEGARSAWRSGKLAQISAGGKLSVIRIFDERLARAALAELQQAGVTVGPVLHHHARRSIDFLVTTRGGEVWTVADTELIARASAAATGRFVSMPAPWAPGRVEGRDWIIRPDGSGQLTNPHNLAAALRRVRPHPQ